MQQDNIIESMPTDAYVCVYHFASHKRERERDEKEYKNIEKPVTGRFVCNKE